MSMFNHLFDVHQQIFSVECCFCNTILLVGVPHSSLSTVVTVACGQCASIISLEQEVSPERVEDEESIVESKHILPAMASSNTEEDEELQMKKVTAPKTRARAPSAYNSFIREEIRRLKSKNPSMTHREAFSKAAKNWAHFSPVDQKGERERRAAARKGSWRGQRSKGPRTNLRGLIPRS